MTRFQILGLGEVLWDLLPSGPRLGGAPCNFAFHCRQLGHSSAIVSRIGADDWGKKLAAELDRLRVPRELVQTDTQHATGTVSVALNEAGHPTYTITENVAWDFIEMPDDLPAIISPAKVICFGSLAQRHETSRHTIRHILEASRSLPGRRIHVFDVNLRQHFYSTELLDASLRLADWVKVNDEELAVLANLFDLPKVTDLSTLASLRERYNLSLACLTRGERGCVVHTADEQIDEPGVFVQVADTVGAGDAFTAGLACLSLEGQPLRSVVRFANRYAARVAASAGATPKIDRESVRDD